MKPNFQSLSIVFPMWNEELLIHSSVAAGREAAEELVLSGEIGTYEIVIVDDASTDATPQLADALAAQDPHIRVVHHEVNRKLGGSIKSGFAAARGELVLYTDADLPFDMAEVAKAVRLMRIYDADLVSAYRFDRTGEGPLRFVYSYLYNHLVRVVLGVRLRDVNFAFKLVRQDVLERAPLRSEGSFIDVELLARAERLGYHVIQFGVDYFPRRRGVSTLSSPSVIANILREMLALGRELRSITPLPPEERRGPLERDGSRPA
jgi:glycosyltransferase involved in cell wall biosynthesis